LQKKNWSFLPEIDPLIEPMTGMMDVDSRKPPKRKSKRENYHSTIKRESEI
jgi:hypothetical protein